jgi:2-aminoadipate transaminase
MALQDAQGEGRPVRLIYSMPTFHNPTGSTLSLARRRRLLEMARRFDAVVLEDDPYFLLRYKGRDLPSLLALDRHGVVIHASTLSKVIAPGIRMGWVLTRSAELLRSVMALKPNGANPFIAAAVLNLLRSGVFDRHLKSIMKFYRKSWQICSEEMRPLAGLGMRLSEPWGGFYYWIRLPLRWRAEDFTAFCVGHGLEILCGDNFFAHAPTGPCVRVAFSSFDHASLRQDLRRLCALAKEYSRSAGRAKTPGGNGRGV